jgi:hypothetical protein
MLLSPLIDPAYYSTAKERDLAERCQKWSKLCYESVAPSQKKPISAPAQRTLKTAMKQFGDFIGVFDHTPNQVVEPHTTAAGIIAATHLLFDAVATGGGITSRTCWQRMDTASVKLCKQIISDYPDAEEVGYDLYLKISEVMG